MNKRTTKNTVKKCGKTLTEKKLAEASALKKSVNAVKLTKTQQAARYLLDRLGGGISAEDYVQKVFQGRTINDFKVATVDGKTGKRRQVKDDYAKPMSFSPNIPLDLMGKFQETFIGWDACAILAQNVWVQRAISQPVDDAIAPDFYFVNGDMDSNDKLTEAELRILKKRADRDFHLSEMLKKASKTKRTFGWSFVIPTFKKGMTPDMSVPFNVQAIKKNSFTGFKVVEPRWLLPEFNYESNLNPTHKDFYEPQWYYDTNGKRIHHSWMRKLVNIDVGDILKPVYFYGGISIPQMIYERIYAAERVADEVPLLVLTKRTFIADAELNNYLANPQEVEDRLRALVMLRDNFGIFVKDIGTQVSQIDTALNGLEEVINSQYYLVAAIAEIPVSKFLKTPIKGMNATGQAEMNDYNQMLKRFQRSDFIPITDFFMQIMTASDGKVLNLDTEFNDLDIPTAREQADINSSMAASIVQLIQIGVIDAKEGRTRLRTAPRSGFSWLSAEPPEQAQQVAAAAVQTAEQRDIHGRFKASSTEN